MPHKAWKITIEEKTHIIEVRWEIWTTSGQLLVDNKVIDAWGPSLTGGGARHFEVANKPAILQSTAWSYKLFVDGKEIKS